MAADMVLALGNATANGHTLLGHNYARPADELQELCRVPGRSFAPGEAVRTQVLELPQARQTCTVVGCRPHGVWGYHHGVNAHGVAAGCGAHRTRMHCPQPGLVGTDLVRLALERGHNARQAVDILTDLLQRHGQGCGAGNDEASDHAVLVADAAEGFVVEASGVYWVAQQVREVRALGDLCTVRQDWDRIAGGLAGYAIAQGWWPDDGSKLDFAGALAAERDRQQRRHGGQAALRRWGRATLLLEQQNGHIDTAFVRRLLSDHFEGCADEVDPLRPSGPAPLCRHAAGGDASATAASLVAELTPDGPPVCWWAFGPPCLGVYFPVLLDGELPEAFGSVCQRFHDFRGLLGRDAASWAYAQDAFDRLQARFDQEAEEFAAREADACAPQAAALMQHQLEIFAATVRDLTRPAPRRAATAVPAAANG